MPEPKIDDEVGELARTLEQMLRSLDAARAEREAAMQKQREFVADASHELRTPLTSILANLELLQASLSEPGQDDDRAMVDSALRSSQRMSRLVADLLLLARADAGKAGAAPPLRPGRDGRRRRGRGGAADGRPRAAWSRTTAPLWLEGNPDELHRLVLNLLDNAARHTPPGATVELRLRAEGGDGDRRGRRRRARDRRRAARARSSTASSAATGPPTPPRGPGSGLGLAIVSAVAASHGGRSRSPSRPAAGRSSGCGSRSPAPPDQRCRWL